MTKTKLPYNEMKQQMLLICRDEKLTLPEIDECSAVMLNFYGWDVREFLDRFCSDINRSMPDYRIRTIEYYILSDEEKAQADTYRKIGRLPLREIDEMCITCKEMAPAFLV